MSRPHLGPLMCALAAALVALGTTSPAGAAEPDFGALRRAAELLEQWQVEDAAAVVAELVTQAPSHPMVRQLEARVRFNQGDYRSARAILESTPGADEAFLTLVRETEELTRDYEVARSAHFVFAYPPGKDAILPRYALEALEAARTRIGADLGYLPPDPIRVEVYPDARALATVSTLSLQEIETSGTIAICKFNRLMITSPKAVVRGYTWLDTLAHEYVHLVVGRTGRNQVPIWLHEATAKYMETRWRGAAGQSLRPAQENLLAKALEKNDLITFEQMHPSMAKLPNQEANSLAFAEVFTVLEYLVHEKGIAGVQTIIKTIGRGVATEEAVAQVLGVSFDRFQENWLAYLRKRPFQVTPGAEPVPVRFTGKGSGEDEDEELATSSEETVRRHARLGDFLRERGRLRAAVIELEKAVAAAGPRHPLLHNRLALTLLQLERPEDALRVLKGVLPVHPHLVTTHVNLGRAYLQLGRAEDAEHHYIEAVRINPFHPEVHLALAKIYHDRGDKEGWQRESEIYALLAQPR